MPNRNEAQTLERRSADTVVDPGNGFRPGFSLVLRNETQAVHREAERTGFIADLIRGRATRAGYTLYLANLLPVYEALEAALAIRHEPLFAPFVDPALWRAPVLRADLDALLAADRLPPPAQLPEAHAYAKAVATAAQEDRLVAHAYARYLGDLSGGQILKPILARTLALTPDMLGFYDFSALGEGEERKAAMRTALDSVDPGCASADAIVVEALAAFRHTIALSTAISAAA